MKITRNSCVTVVVPKTATSRETFAAGELKKYLSTIFSGINVTCVDDASNMQGAKILIGGPERNAQTAGLITEEEFDKKISGPEGMFLKTYGDVLVLAGSSKNVDERERGTIYAVYELLERYMGCSLAAYVNPEIVGGEYIPNLVAVRLITFSTTPLSTGFPKTVLIGY